MSIGLEKLALVNDFQKVNELNWIVKPETIRTKTPSRLKGMDLDEELKLRRHAIRFIKKLAESAYNIKYKRKYYDMYVRVLSTSALYLHRFFMVHPLQLFDPYDVAAACFYLATKAEDLPLNLSTVSIFTVSVSELFGISTQRSPLEIEEEIKDLENWIMTTLGFQVMVHHPYLYIPGLVDHLIGDPEKIEHIQQLASQYAMESLGTVFCVRIHPRKLAIIFITWACDQEGFALNNWKSKAASSEQTHWLQSFKLKQEDVEVLYAEYIEHLRLDNAENEQLRKCELRRARFQGSLQRILTDLRQEPIVDKNANFQFDFNALRSNDIIF